MTISKEQFEIIATIGRFSVVERDSGGDITRMYTGLTEISIENDPNLNGQVVTIVGISTRNEATVRAKFYDPTARFVPEDSDDPRNNLTAQKVLLAGEGLPKPLILDKEGVIFQSENPEQGL